MASLYRRSGIYWLKYYVNGFFFQPNLPNHDIVLDTLDKSVQLVRRACLTLEYSSNSYIKVAPARPAARRRERNLYRLLKKYTEVPTADG